MERTLGWLFGLGRFHAIDSESHLVIESEVPTLCCQRRPICITSTAAQPHSSHAIPMLQENTLQSALASLLRSQKDHIVALQHAIAQNHVANNVPLPPDLHACNGQAHGDPHAKAK